MKKLWFRSRENAMHYVVLSRFAKRCLDESPCDLISFANDCLVECDRVLSPKCWDVHRVIAIAEEVWHKFDVD